MPEPFKDWKSFDKYVLFQSGNGKIAKEKIYTTPLTYAQMQWDEERQLMLFETVG